MSLEQLQGRDYVLIVDRSGSMNEPHKGDKTRYQAAEEGTVALARAIEKFDSDGIDVYTFSGDFKRYPNVTADAVKNVFKEISPRGSTALDKVLKDALDHAEKSRAAGGKPTTIVVVTDGEPDDRKAVARVIVEASNKLDKDEDLAIQFVQIGDDARARDFLRSLDDDLTAQGAKFDIVDALTSDEADNMSFEDQLLKAITD